MNWYQAPAARSRIRKGGKFLAFRVSRANGKSAGRHAVNLSLRYGAKIAGAEKYAYLIEIIWPVDPRVHAKTGEAQIGFAWRRLGLSKIEQIRRVGDKLSSAVAHHVYLNAILEYPAAVEKLHLKWEFFCTPQGLLGPETNRAVGVIINVLELVRERLIGSFVWLACKFVRLLTHRICVKRLILGRSRVRADDQ